VQYLVRLSFFNTSVAGCATLFRELRVPKVATKKVTFRHMCGNVLVRFSTAIEQGHRDQTRQINLCGLVPVGGHYGADCANNRPKVTACGVMTFLAVTIFTNCWSQIHLSGRHPPPANTALFQSGRRPSGEKIPVDRNSNTARALIVLLLPVAENELLIVKRWLNVI
jgi:hypothetical protein